MAHATVCQRCLGGGQYRLVPLPVVAIMTSMYSCAHSCLSICCTGAPLPWMAPGTRACHAAVPTLPSWRLVDPPLVAASTYAHTPPPAPLCITHTSTHTPLTLMDAVLACLCCLVSTAMPLFGDLSYPSRVYVAHGTFGV